MTAFSVFKFFLECAATCLVFYAIYREKDIKRFERKVWKYTKAFFKAVFYTLKDKFAPVKEKHIADNRVNEEYESLLASFGNEPVKVIDFKIAS